MNIIPVQLLDGVGSGLVGVATPGLLARILQGSGHVNLGLGLGLTIQGIGAALSKAWSGMVAHYFNYSNAFIALSAAPMAGLAIFLWSAHILPDPQTGITPASAKKS